MGNEWKEVRLGEVAKFSYGKMPKKEILNTGIYPTFSGYKYQYKYPEYNCEKGDIIVVARGVGGTGDVKIVKEKCYLTNLSIKIELNQGEILNKYLYYKFYLTNLRYLDSGSAQSQITIGDLERVNIGIPPLPTQKKIAEILSSLDDKIELNNQMNKTLEEMAQAIFKQWFVDFEFPNENGEPYKSSGGEMVESELGLIPKGWRVGVLEEIIDFIVDNRGKTPLIIDEAGKKYPLIEVNALTSNSRTIILGNVKKYVDKNTYDNWFRKGHPKKDDVLISTVGSIGEIALVYDEEICIAQNIIAIRGKSSGVFMYQLLQSIVEKIKSLNISSVQPSIKVPHLLSSKIIIPNTEIINYFVEKVTDSSNNIFYNTQQNNNLTQIRDNLLPKLMNGEIELGDLNE